jgi:hypothetical protein
MKNPIRLFLLGGALSTSIVFATLQQSQGDPKPIQRDTPSLRQRLALTRDQQVQFRAINKDRKAQLDAVQADTSLTPSTRKQKVKEIHGAAETKIRAMLNQNQLDEYDQIKRERREAAIRKRETTTPAPQNTTPPDAAPPQ